MEIEIKNFGPIQDVSIHVSPLTTIIGRNNLGKSYLSQLYYALLDSTIKFSQEVLSSRYFYYQRYGRVIFHGPFDIDYRQLKLDTIPTRQIKKDMSDSEIIQIILSVIENRYQRILQRILRLSLERTFAVKINKLVNIASTYAQVKWDLFQNYSCTLHIGRRAGFKLELVINDNGKKILKDIKKGFSEELNKIRRARTRKAERITDLMDILIQKLMVWKTTSNGDFTWPINPRRRNSAYYIPAGRGGLLESYETVVGGLISISPLAPVRGLSMPPLPGMASQFYNVILRLRGEKGPLSRKTAGLFRDLLGGDVELKKIPGQAKSRLVYRFSVGKKKSSTDVVHAASMIKELSPIYLIVQELLRPGDFFLIEEPESHLHPGAQIKLVNIISSLVKNHVNVFLTTHSDIFLRKIAHLFTKNLHENIEIDERKYQQKTVAIYWLKDGEKGCTSELIDLDKYGILEEIPTFDDVVRDLYEEELKLEKASEGRD